MKLEFLNMKIEFLNITIRELAEGYQDDGVGGVRGYDGILDIRPPYQREFVYKDKQREAVINTVMNGFPLNVMYWAERDDGTFEIIDGQQRTISICQYVNNAFSVQLGNWNMSRMFGNLSDDEQNTILDYELMIYTCTGPASERLKWYEIINIAGEVLTRQELRNAVYAGAWLSDARRYFSRPGGAAYGLGSPYLSGSALRQDYLETSLKWISARDGVSIDDYMAKHQKDPVAIELWNYFQNVIAWVEAIFPKKRSSMKGVDWGPLYDAYHGRSDLLPTVLETEVARLHKDDDVKRKTGIYPYLLTGDEKHLNIRAFTQAMREAAYERQEGICSQCNKKYDLSDMHADHIDPWSQGGKTSAENCQMLCKSCNRRKSDK